MPEIQLTQGQTAIVGEEDYEYLMQWKWHINNSGYVVRNSEHVRGQKRTGILMHRVIIERMIDGSIPKGYEVDHINRGRIDNRRENLRLVTRSQNKANMASLPGTSSQYKGVCWHRSGKWLANVKKDGVDHRLGGYTTEEEAARAYDAKAKELFGEFARLNFPSEEE